MNRRSFLRALAHTVVVASCGKYAGNGGDGGSTVDAAGGHGAGPDGGPPQPPLVPTSPQAVSDQWFPQGLVSGEPQATSVVLWTRVALETVARGAAAREVAYVVARDEALTDIVARGTVTTSAEADYTVQLQVEALAPYTYYYYRFAVGDATTQVGRTKTAPALDQAVDVSFMFASCQDFIGRHYHSWRAFLELGREVDFVMFLGDYIYETVNDPAFQSTDPSARTIELPDGLDISADQDRSKLAAGSLADYRALYKRYRSDPLLKEVHRRFPFVVIWDDHEFANDCWGDHVTDFNEKPNPNGPANEQASLRRKAANRAFAEYQPLHLQYDDTASATQSIRIYRQLRFGQRLDVFMTDQRLYRDDHIIPEGPRDVLAGKLTKYSSFGARVLPRKSVVDAREAESRPTMLGAVQKQWFLQAVQASTATWKVWGNEVQLNQQIVDLSALPGVPNWLNAKNYLSSDQWDGYRSERREILQALRGVANLVACTGDIHTFFAAELHVDFDAPAAPSAVEYVTSSISSATGKAIMTNALGQVSLPASVVSAVADGLEEILRRHNPHIKHADAQHNGFAIATVTSAAFDVEFFAVGDATAEAYPGIGQVTKFRTRAGTSRVERLP